MTLSSTCHTCGAPLDQTADGELCSSCMMREVMELESDTATPAAGLPRRFGGYELLEEIGRGGMGAIYRARQLSLNREVAIKLLLAGGFSSEAMLGRFRVEASAVAGLRHPNVVAIHDYGEADGQPFYAMDLVQGRNLAELCDGRPLAPRRAAELIRTLSEAVQHAHEHGVLHRDLKPSNVIIDAKDGPRITDFGLAKISDSEEVATMTGQTLGTPGYLAPEQARGTSEAVSPATDIYGLGALLFHLLTGRAPFNAATPLETFQLVLKNPAPSPLVFNPSLPRDLVTICLKCLVTDPSRRYASAAELAEDADRFLTDRPILARPPGRLYRSGKYIRRHWIGVSAAAAVILALTVGLVASLISYRRAVSERALANAARERSEQVVEGILNDLQPHLDAASRQEALIASIKTTIRYFDELPTEMRDLETKRKHAREIDRLLRIMLTRGGRSYAVPEIRETYQRSIQLWREVAENDPNDAEAAVAALEGEFRLATQGPYQISPDQNNVRGIYSERYQELERRFPDSYAVQVGFADVLQLWASYHAIRIQADEAIEYLADAKRRLDLGVAGDPNDVSIRLRQIQFLIESRKLYDTIGRREAARDDLVEARAIAESLLRRDPANLRYIYAVAGVINQQSYRATPDELEGKTHEVQSYVAKMLLLDPNNTQWITWDANLLIREGFSFAADRRLVEARDRFEKALDVLEALQGDEFEYGPRYSQALQMLGTVAAQAGDFETAHACRDKVLVKFADGGRLQLSANRARERSAWVLLADLKDWPQLETRLRGLVDPIAAPEPKDGYYWTDHARAGEAEYARALVMQGRHAEALPFFAQAMYAFVRPHRMVGGLFRYPEWRRWETAELYAEALYQTGDYDKAVEWQEWALARYEAHVAAGGKLLSRIATARCAWKLAELLETSEGENRDRRKELLGRAVELLDSPRTEPRLLTDEREMRMAIEAEMVAVVGG